MKNIFLGLLATLLFSNFTSAQLMSDVEHRAMMNTYVTNLNNILNPYAIAEEITLDQLKKEIANGTYTLQQVDKTNIITAAIPLLTYGTNFAAAKGLTANTDALKYFYSTFVPSTTVQNGKLTGITIASGHNATEMWNCALESFNTNTCNAGFSALIGDKTNLNTLATSITNRFNLNIRNLAILVTLNGFADCIYNQLGHKLKNPYATANMTQAFNNIKPKMSAAFASSTSGFTINTSHLYVKIEPKDAIEESLLKRDSTQYFFDYPIDFVFSEETLNNIGTGNENVIGTYYAAVPVNYVFPAGINKTILDELYIPEQDPYFDDAEDTGMINPTTINTKEDFFGQLIIAAYTQTNNEEQLGIETSPTGRSGWWFWGKKWRPSGTITMDDDAFPERPVPVEGAKILMRQWFTVKSVTTDSNGYFETGRIRGKARYYIQWERKYYDIRNNYFGQAESRISGYVQNQAVIHNIVDDETKQFAMIHRAAHHYFYGYIAGLKRPTEVHHDNITIAAIKNRTSTADFNHFRGTAGIWPTVRIYRRDYCYEYYGTTIHELAHASHSDMGNITYIDTESKVKESWARGVQWVLTRMIYHDYMGGGFVPPNYTEVVMDMIDYESDDSVNDDGLNASAGDNVEGYTIKEIEDAITGKKTWDDWKNNIYNKYSNATKENLDDLFYFWN